MADRKRRSAAVRCAIYTRKSSEEGLEQDFNSLDAQREACEAFILSQKHEGWIALPERYDDGGVSGATMERPALKRLLADSAAGKVDAVVVYKVDRLTRCLGDFVRIVEVFDRQKVSFISVTQQFNTTTSMGRLTLNMLLSFAQFEREVTGERIRDKIAASKRKGMWMGGLPPLGYDARDRKLAVNKAEAGTVRHIYRRYAELRSVRRLKEELDRDGTVSKRRIDRHSRATGGKPFSRGALYLMLQNRIYRGEIVHKDKSYPGQHDAIIDADLWRRVQTVLVANRVERANGTHARRVSLLAGFLYDDTGDRMIPSHAAKKGRRYRYYVSRQLVTGSRNTAPDGCRVPAGDVEQLVEERLLRFLRDPCELHSVLADHLNSRGNHRRLLAKATEVAKTWSGLSTPARREFMQTHVERVDVTAGSVEIRLKRSRLLELLDDRAGQISEACGSPCADEDPVLSVPARLRRTGMEMRLLIDGAGDAQDPDPALLRMIAQAHELREIFCRGNASIAEMASEAGLSRSHFTRVLRLAFLAPDITDAILFGRQPPELTARRLMRGAPVPIGWNEQRRALGIA